VSLAAGPPGTASKPFPAGARPALAGSSPASEAHPLVLDRPFAIPSGAVSPATAAAVATVLDRQSRALRAADAAAYLRTLAQPSASGPASGVAGDPRARAAFGLAGLLPPGASVSFAQIAPLFLTPGPDGQVEVLTHHLVVCRQPRSAEGLLEVLVIERLRPAESGPASISPNWEVFDWTLVEETSARLTWPVWLSGRVTFEPFDSRLRAEMTYTLYDGYPRSPAAGFVDLAFALAGTLRVSAVRGEAGDLSWRQEGESIRISLPDPGPDRPLTVTIVYDGKVTSTGTAHRGNLEYLGAEVIYLRPESDWYPRPCSGKVVGPGLRGLLAVTVPAWWGAAAPGRLVETTPAAGMGETRTFTWGLDLPAEIYLSAGPYLMADRPSARGVTLRTFFYAREAALAEAYLTESERILDVFSDRFGAYPYPSLSLAEVQDFYYGGLSARTLVLLEKDWQADPVRRAAARDLLAHEIAHQWWGEIIPISGKADWFLWEGLASYSEALYAEVGEGPAGLQRVMALKSDSYARAARGQWSLRQVNPRAADWQDAYIYDKGAWLFHSLRFLLGDESFFKLLRDYVDRFAGRQPGVADLAGLIAEAAPGDPYLAAFTDWWVEHAADPDLALAHVSLSGAMGANSAGTPGGQLAFSLVDRGSGAFPRAEVKIIYADGRTETVLAQAGVNSREVSGRVTSLVVDPDYRCLDLDRRNNVCFIVGGVGVSLAVTLVWATALLRAILLAAVTLVVCDVRRRRRLVAQRG
jgi:hypothetical protein